MSRLGDDVVKFLRREIIENGDDLLDIYVHEGKLRIDSAHMNRDDMVIPLQELREWKDGKDPVPNLIMELSFRLQELDDYQIRNLIEELQSELWRRLIKHRSENRTRKLQEENS